MRADRGVDNWRHGVRMLAVLGLLLAAGLPALLDAGDVSDAFGRSLRRDPAHACRLSSSSQSTRRSSRRIPVATWLANSAIVATGTMVLSIALAILPAYALSRFRFRGKGALGFALFATQMLPEAMLVVPLYAIFGQLDASQHADRAHPREHGLYRPGDHLDSQGCDRRRSDRHRGSGAYRRLLADRHRTRGRDSARRARRSPPPA